MCFTVKSGSLLCQWRKTETYTGTEIQQLPPMFLCVCIFTYPWVSSFVCCVGVDVSLLTCDIVIFSVVKLPGPPQLSPLYDFLHCHQCIKAIPGITVTVKCNSTGGSPPQLVKIYKDGQEMKQSTFQASVAKLSYSFTASEDFEWSTIICNISNDAATTPFSTNATVYLYRKYIDFRWKLVIDVCHQPIFVIYTTPSCLLLSLCKSL